MRFFIRRFVRSVLALVVLLCVLFGFLDYYFVHVSHIRSRVVTAFETRVHKFRIHVLGYNEIPTEFRQAIIATEDRRFAWDPGIDPVGILRSLIVDVEKDGYVEGGSTITQQLVDNTILNQQKTLTRKAKQAFYAIGLYDTMTKLEVFQLYTNVIYFGHGAYGLYNAAETYFGKTPRQLNGGELTMLAGLPNSPHSYDPFRSMQLARARQRVVLTNMVDDGVLTKSEANHIWNLPIRLRTTSLK